MLRTLRSIYSSMSRSPLKSALTLITVGMGVGILIIAMSISFTLRGLIDSELQHEGRIIMVANGSFGDGGALELVRPSQFDTGIAAVLETEVEGVRAVSPISAPFWTTFRAGEEEFRIRSILGTSEAYPPIAGFTAVAGSFFDASDVENGERSAVITESLATMLYGSPAEAVGQVIRPPASQTAGSQQGGGRLQVRVPTAPSFTIVGVVEDPSELKRKSYGIADMIVPHTSILPAGGNVARIRDFLMSNLAVRIQGVSVEAAEAQIRDVVQRRYGDGVALEIWEGTPSGASAYLAELRASVSTFSLVVNLLGFFLLAAASIGILSIMVVEALGRSKEIALERALGASKKDIVREFFTRSVIISLVSAVLGILLSLVFARPLAQLVLPVFDGTFSAQFAGVVDIRSVLLSSAAAVVIGGVFGALPVFTVFQGAIAEAIREG